MATQHAIFQTPQRNGGLSVMAAGVAGGASVSDVASGNGGSSVRSDGGAPLGGSGGTRNGAGAESGNQ